MDAAKWEGGLVNGTEGQRRWVCALTHKERMLALLSILRVPTALLRAPPCVGGG